MERYVIDLLEHLLIIDPEAKIMTVELPRTEHNKGIESVITSIKNWNENRIRLGVVMFKHNGINLSGFPIEVKIDGDTAFISLYPNSDMSEHAITVAMAKN